MRHVCMRMRHVCMRMRHVCGAACAFERGAVLHMSLKLRHPLPETRRSIRMQHLHGVPHAHAHVSHAHGAVGYKVARGSVAPMPLH